MLCTVVLARAEPPVNQYLPPNSNGQGNSGYSPQNANSFGQQNGPSTNYGPPLAGNQINNNGQPTDSYSLTNSVGRTGGINGSQRPSQTYGPPNQSFAPINQQGNDGSNFQNTANRPPIQGNQTPQDSYGPPNSVNENKGQQNRGSTTFNGNRNNQGSPSDSYGPPAIQSGTPLGTGQIAPNQSNQRGQFGSQNANAPQTSYGAPEAFGKIPSQGFDGNQRPSDSYGPPTAINPNERTESDSYAPSVGQRNNPQNTYGPPSSLQSNQQSQFGGTTGFGTSLTSSRNNDQSGYPTGPNASTPNSEQGYPGGSSNSQNGQGYNTFGNNSPQGLAGANSFQGNSGIGGGASNGINGGSNVSAYLIVDMLLR